MIIKTSNNPIEITFEDNMESIETIRVTLWNNGTCLKTWEKNDLQIDDNLVKANLTQEETKIFPIGRAILEIKWLDGNGITEFSEQSPIYIVDRLDTEVMSND